MKHPRFFPILLIAAILLMVLPQQVSAALDMWLKIEGNDTVGEAQDKVHKDWIDVLAWSWGGSQSGTFHIGGGGGAGKANFQDLTVTKFTDKASPALLQAVASGRRFPTVWLDVARGNGGTVVERLALRDVTITSVSLGGTGSEDRLTESVSLSFTKVEKGYVALDTKTGKTDQARTFSYDRDKEVAEITNRLPVLDDDDRDGIDNVEDQDQDNNGIGDEVETLPVAASPGKAGITGFAWLDDDANGLKGVDERAAAGTRVELYLDGADRPVQSRAINEETGGYAFLELDPGSYKVRFVPSVGFQFGTQAGESVADPTTGFSPAVAIAAGTNVARSAAILSDENAYSAFSYTDFSEDEEDLFHSGDASVIDDVVTGLPILQLTPDFPQVVGSTFYNRSVVASTFTSHFQFRMRGDGLKGEGFTFVVRDPFDMQAESFLAGGGGGLGYAGMGESFAVEFDTFPSGGSDPNGAHVGVLINGDISNVSGSTGETGLLGQINSGAIWNAWIDYDGSEVQVFLSDTPVKPQSPLVSRLVSLPERRAFVGFTAATFSASQAHEILSWEYEGGQNNTLVVEPSTSQAELNAIIKAPGTIIIENDARTDLTMTALTTVCGDLIIRNNGNLQTINLPKLIEVFGDVIIENNDALTGVNVDSLREVTGDVRISTDATISSDFREVQSENVNVVGLALENFVGKTGYGETKVEFVDEATKMELNIPEGAFTVPETFEVEQLSGPELDGLLTGALDSDGAVVDVVPVLGFEYSFKGGGINLNKEVEIQFEISLDDLPANARANILNAYDSGTLTVFGSRSEDVPMEVFAVCDVLDFGVWDNCARARALDSAGNPVASFVASVLEFTVFARHFSTYGVAVIEPVEITQADLDQAARRVGASLQVLPTSDGIGGAEPQTFTLFWTSYAVATAADGTLVHPANRIETSTDLETWTAIDDFQDLEFLNSSTNTRSVTLVTPDGGSERYYRVVVGQ